MKCKSDVFVTVYTHKVKRRATGKFETIGCAYQTKSHTAMHEHLRRTYSDAQTFRNPDAVITDFIPGMNLRSLPIVRGGERIG